MAAISTGHHSTSEWCEHLGCGGSRVASLRRGAVDMTWQALGSTATLTWEALIVSSNAASAKIVQPVSQRWSPPERSLRSAQSFKEQ